MTTFRAATQGLLACVVSACLLGGFGITNMGCSGGGSSGGGGGAAAPTPTVSAPAQGAFVGQLVDQNNTPVPNATVSVDGISTTTNGSGQFALNSTPVAVTPVVVGGRVNAAASASVPVGVVGPGINPVEISVNFVDGEIPSMQVLRPTIVAGLDVVKPHSGCDFVVPTNCPNPFIPVEGFASLTARDSLSHDICLLIDRSGSASQPVSFEVNNAPNTIIGAEVEAARCFVDSLGLRSRIRLSVIAFSDNGQTQVYQSFTSDRAQVKAALTQILSDPIQGGTNFAEAIDAVRAQFATLDAGNAALLAQDTGGEVRVLPKRICMMLTDGIPTAPFGSNLTQEREDRAAGLEAARRAVADSIEIHGFALIRTNDPQGTLATLPQMSAITGGTYTRIEDESTLQSSLCGKAFTQVLEVRVRNQSIGNSEVVATVAPDGFFALELPVTLLGQNTAVNTIQITVSSPLASQTLVRTIDVELHAQAVVGTENYDLISLQPVSSAGIVTADGSAPGRDSLRQFLVSQFPDALQVRGVESFSVNGPTGNTVSVQVDLVFEAAGYGSDFGYFPFDPANPPTTAAAALQNAVVMFNTTGISGGSLPSGQHRFNANFTAGQTVGFFVIPNDTLARARAGNARNEPLFTLSALNPGGLSQVLNFQSAAGRTTATPANPNSLVFGFEDLAIAARRRSDRDFDDVVFTVTSVIRPRPTPIICR